MVERTVTVQNINGIHCRPSTHIFKEAVKYSSSLTAYTTKGSKANLKSMIQIISLALHKGDSVTVEADGVDETEALNAMARVFQAIYDYSG